MNDKLLKLLLIVLSSVFCGGVGYAQSEELVPDSSTFAVQNRLQLFQKDLLDLQEYCNTAFQFSGSTSIQSSLVGIYMSRVKSLENNLLTFNSRFNTYMTAQQYEIAANEDLMNQMAELELLKQAVSDTIEVRKQACSALHDFFEGETFIMKQDSIYKRMYSRASKLSLVAKAAPLLEKLKAREQMAFARIDQYYGNMKAAVELLPSLSERMIVVDDKYFILKAMSGKIQAMEYKPFIQRAKDYLLGFAAVAIILLFLNLVASKFSAIRNTYKSMQQFKNLLKSNQQGDYPTI